MARVEPRKSTLARVADWYCRRNYGRSIETTGVLAHNPWNLIGYGTLEYGTEHSHKMSERLKLLAATKSATQVGCQFCIDIGTALGRDAGVTDDQIRDFHSYMESAAFSEDEKLVIEYAEQMTNTPVNISDELFARLREHFDEAQIVELTAAIAIENLRARFNNALDIPPAGFSEGKTCPLPDHVAAAASNGAETAQAGRTIA